MIVIILGLGLDIFENLVQGQFLFHSIPNSEVQPYIK